MKILSVSQLTGQLKSIIEQSALMNNIWLRGEISNFKQHISGHCYFTLKDSGAVIRAVMFKSRASGLRFVPANGMSVIVNGRVTIYERDGNYQLYVDKILPDGIGELWASIEQLRDKLAKEGLFAAERKRRLPLLPRKICVISSPTGAVVRDIISVAGKRNPAVQIILFPSQVQGEEASRQICKALSVINAHRLADVIIIARGGGSVEDLQVFNDEQLLRAVAASVIPVVSAIGHETDFTLCDAVADLRAATPSQAAELVIPSRQELFDSITANVNILHQRLKHLLGHERKMVSQLIRRKAFLSPQTVYEKRRMELDGKLAALNAGIGSIFENKRNEYHLQCEKLAMLNPLAVLRRGFAVVTDSDGQVIKSITQITPNSRVYTRIIDGCFSGEVIKVVPENVYEK